MAKIKWGGDLVDPKINGELYALLWVIYVVATH